MRPIGLLLSCLAILLSGCGGNSADAPESNSVVIAGSTWYGHIPAIYGVESGIFEKHGFDVEFRPVSTSADRMKAITAGSVQFASLGQIAMLSQMANDNRSFYWVGNQDIAPGFEGIVARPGINSFADLKGKKLGLVIASSVEITVYQLLAQNGLSAEDVQLVPLKPAEVATAMENGSIDAGAVWEPHFSRIQAIDGATLLGLDTDTEIYKQYKTMTGPDVLVISKEWVDADPDRARRFMTAYWECVDTVKADTDAAIDTVAANWFKDADAIPGVKANMKRFVWLGLQDQKTILSDKGIFPQTTTVLKLLAEDIGKIPTIPAFAEWVNTDVLPFD
jgi:NitT/TauT family transport system substrate-binding protein